MHSVYTETINPCQLGFCIHVNVLHWPIIIQRDKILNEKKCFDTGIVMN